MLTRPFWVCVLLAVATVFVYWPAVGFDYVDYDDPKFIITNPHVLGGLTWENVRWAFGTVLDCNWIPLTWLSYMLDVELYGSTASGLHLTNILLHSVNTILVFLVFRQLTGAHWPSAVLAALFGLHPLHVESVAWVAERKDVLCTLFWWLAIWRYARYVQNLATGSRRWSRDYFLSLIFFMLGLMSKPMAVSLPFVLLLLDYWPLRRIEPENINGHRTALVRLICEKTPFFVFAAIISGLTIFLQSRTNATVSLATLPIGARISNAMVAYAFYLEKTFWPADLANPYPLISLWPWGRVFAACTAMIVLSTLAVLMRQRRPYFLVGWLWFLGTLIPVIGLVQVGTQSMADRYTYIPLLGVFWIVVGAVADLVKRWRPLCGPVVLIALLMLGACAAQTRVQLQYWRNGESLFHHSIVLTKANFIAFDGLGYALYSRGQVDAAVSNYVKALEIRPDYSDALTNLGDALDRLDAVDANAKHPHPLSLETSANYAYAHNILGAELALNGKLDDAILHFRRALIYNPVNVTARCNLGYALALQNRLNEAIWQCELVLRLSPHYPIANNTLGFALLKQGRSDEAVPPLREALLYQPDYADAHVNLGMALAALGHRDEAIAHFKEALRLEPNSGKAREQLKKLESLPK